MKRPRISSERCVQSFVVSFETGNPSARLQAEVDWLKIQGFNQDERVEGALTLHTQCPEIIPKRCRRSLKRSRNEFPRQEMRSPSHYLSSPLRPICHPNGD